MSGCLFGPTLGIDFVRFLMEGCQFRIAWAPICTHKLQKAVPNNKELSMATSESSTRCPEYCS